ncbi:MAG TPA: shikimate dehydrogenase [Anaerolineales bacterium]|nr:shikimate dehydrogenase [Anaerolineales bacterium]
MPLFNLGLIGYPLSHSLSPNIHSAALRACGFEGDYSLFPIYPEDKNGLQDLLSRVRSGEIHGLNVTIPHKQNVISFLDVLTSTSEAIGAVNTIYLREGKLIGDNTDAAGFLTDLKNFLATAEQSNESKSALILGAGGSARAVVYALLNDGWDVIIAARRIEQAQHLADSIANTKSPDVVSSFTDVEFSKIALIVNTTPVGMTPNIDQSPLPENLSLPRHVSMYDLVYNPRETKLVKEARARGLNATTGLGMLIEQAALAFELWTGHNPSREIMRASVEGSPVSN